MVGEVGAGPTTPEETDLQSAAFADSLLPVKRDAHLSLFALTRIIL